MQELLEEMRERKRGEMEGEGWETSLGLLIER